MKCPTCDFETQGQFCGESGTRLPKGSTSSGVKWLTLVGMIFLFLFAYPYIIEEVAKPYGLGNGIAYLIWGLLGLGLAFLTRWIIKKGIHTKKPFKIGCFVLVGLVSGVLALGIIVMFIFIVASG